MSPTAEHIASIIAGAAASRLFDDLRLRIPLPTPEAQAATSPAARLAFLALWAPAHARRTAMFLGVLLGIGGAVSVAMLTGQVPLSPEATLIAALYGALASQIAHAGTLSHELPEADAGGEILTIGPLEIYAPVDPAVPAETPVSATPDAGAPPDLHTRIEQRLRERPSIRPARAGRERQ